MPHLPPELIQRIYFYLGPTDFHSASLVCRTWQHASRDLLILHEQMRRGGWSSPVGCRRLSSAASLYDYIYWECSATKSSTPSRPITLSFAEEAAIQHDAPVRCYSTSLCGKVLAAASRSEIAVYRLVPTGVYLEQRIRCPRRVLALCLDDAATQIVALMEGRTAMHIRLHHETTAAEASQQSDGTLP